ncbi:MAG: lipid IV(A) 3-deoxy-D-manno-octulosonic acid transferase [Gammaproteobacteria bacterium]|nr:lipid IV(A) 3-deoxy-D-manno-octulosonic acid transferase [Gammaproteobacteria bacterium]
MRTIYSILFYLGMPFVWLRLLWRSRRDPNYAKRWSERLGYVPKNIHSNCIWWHCVSVGETLAALPLIKSLMQRYPNISVLVTGMTPSGSAQIQKHLGGAVSHMYAPYDLPHLWGRFLKKINPKLLIIMETELWPNMLAKCHEKKIPTILINARLSEKSAKGYGKFSGLIKEMLDNLNIVAVQNQQDGERFIKLGLPPERLHVTGTVKFDITISAQLLQKARELRASWNADRPVFIAASTHEGEEKIILEAFKKISAQDPDTLLILAPRHPERRQEIVNLCESYGFSHCLRSQNEIPQPNTKVFIADTMGELLLFYAVSDIAFVGGSLIERGGHNILEPAAIGIPVITGPFLYNFAQIDRLLSGSEALIKVKNAEGLATAVLGLLNDAKKRDAVGKRGEAVIAKNRGASEKQLNLIERLINMDNSKSVKKALILVDLQNDFMPGGSLGVQEGDQVVPIANKVQEKFDIVIASKDWHPQNHVSFINLWPSHCVQHSFGAEFEKHLNTDKIQKIIHKGTQVEIDSYSAFFDNSHQHKTELDDYLKTLGVTDIYVMGLATNYCVKYSVLDAIKLGYDVTVIEDGCRGIGDTTEAWAEIKQAGAKIICSKDLL